MRTLSDRISLPSDADASPRTPFMNIDRFSPAANSTRSTPANTGADEPSAPVLERLRVRVRAAARNPRVAPVALFASGVVAALLAVLIYQALTPAPHLLTTRDVSDTVAQAFASATPEPALSVAVYRAVQPSLVFIESETPPGADGNPGHGVGSGVIINDQGDILTSLHVVTEATQIELTFADGTKSSAQISNAQPENDIAVLHADKPPAQIVPATLGNPGAARVGDEAFVVGNPFGLYSSMSSGIISGFNRSIQPVNSSYKLNNLIQIDAAVNPGNSGGPLLNRHGEVIGIVTGLVNPTDQNFFIGVGFAVPITTASSAAGAPPY